MGIIRKSSFCLNPRYNTMTNSSQALNTVVLDVRSPAEYATGHVDGSINLPLDRFVDGYRNFVTDKAQRVVICCASGARSGQAVQFLTAQGYSNVVNGISSHQVASSLGMKLV
jgi:phage shock protein E